MKQKTVNKLLINFYQLLIVLKKQKLLTVGKKI
jgi:hypothetical protein